MHQKAWMGRARLGLCARNMHACMHACGSCQVACGTGTRQPRATAGTEAQAAGHLEGLSRLVAARACIVPRGQGSRARSSAWGDGLLLDLSKRGSLRQQQPLVVPLLHRGRGQQLPGCKVGRHQAAQRALLHACRGLQPTPNAGRRLQSALHAGRRLQCALHAWGGGKSGGHGEGTLPLASFHISCSSYSGMLV